MSPLLLCIGLNSLSQIINKSGYGYKFRNGATISHLLYTDDIKLYIKNEHDINSQIPLTGIDSNDIRMSFRLDKCGQMVSWRGRMTRTEGVELPEGNIVDVQDSYRYLGVPKANSKHEETAQRSATPKYLQRVRQVRKSQLNGKNKIQAINTYPLPAIRYSVRIISWPLEEVQAPHVKKRTLLTMHGGFHPTSSILRSYAKQREGTKD